MRLFVTTLLFCTFALNPAAFAGEIAFVDPTFTTVAICDHFDDVQSIMKAEQPLDKLNEYLKKVEGQPRPCDATIPVGTFIKETHMGTLTLNGAYFSVSILTIEQTALMMPIGSDSDHWPRVAIEHPRERYILWLIPVSAQAVPEAQA